MRIVQPDEDGGCFCFFVSENFPEIPRSGKILVLEQEDVFLIAVHIRVLEDPVSSSVNLDAFTKAEGEKEMINFILKKYFP